MSKRRPIVRSCARAACRKANNPPKVVMNGGAWVFGPSMKSWVDLGTMAIDIERTENNALLTKDPQYADIQGHLFTSKSTPPSKVSLTPRAPCGKQVDVNAVKQLVEAKLDGARATWRPPSR
ncbi:MAG: hypothetical protein IPM84_20000 [Anaerolineae bacterium]|nr:hypothetical protein [Anaerolineae bacterium]